MSGAGILGAMLQGLGKGSIENIEQMRKEAEINKQLDWREKESEKQREFDSEQNEKKFQHEINMENIKYKNELVKAAYTARVNAKYGKDTLSETEKNLLSATQTLDVYDKQLNALHEKLSATEDKEQQNAITTRIKAISDERDNYLKLPETITAFKAAGQMGRALYSTRGGNMDLFPSKPVVRGTVAEDVKSSVAPPVRNMIDVNNLTPQQAADIARQKSEDAARLQFAKASADAKDWAQKRTQYQSSTFIPRTF